MIGYILNNVHTKSQELECRYEWAIVADGKLTRSEKNWVREIILKAAVRTVNSRGVMKTTNAKRLIT